MRPASRYAKSGATVTVARVAAHSSSPDCGRRVDAERQRGQPGADETHVVVQRQPARDAVALAHLEGTRDRGEVARDHVTRERDALRRARASGRELHQRDVRERDVPRMHLGVEVESVQRQRRRHTVENRDGAPAADQ